MKVENLLDQNERGWLALRLLAASLLTEALERGDLDFETVNWAVARLLTEATMAERQSKSLDAAIKTAPRAGRTSEKSFTELMSEAVERNTGVFVTKLVRDLHVNCSLQVRNFNQPGVAASDCCGKPADTAVEMDGGRRMWRCEEHRGIRRLEMGNVWETVEVRDHEH